MHTYTHTYIYSTVHTYILLITLEQLFVCTWRLSHKKKKYEYTAPAIHIPPSTTARMMISNTGREPSPLVDHEMDSQETLDEQDDEVDAIYRLFLK